MSIACSQSKRKSASSHLNFESVSENRNWLCSFISIEIDENTYHDKKWFDWMNRNSCLV